jgi:hypothetical protein
MTVTWTAATDNPGGSGVLSYLIYRNPGKNGGTEVISTQAATTLSYTDTGSSAALVHGTTYCYSVAAQDASLNRSAPSAELCRRFP